MTYKWVSKRCEPFRCWRCGHVFPEDEAAVECCNGSWTRILCPECGVKDLDAAMDRMWKIKAAALEFIGTGTRTVQVDQEDAVEETRGRVG